MKESLKEKSWFYSQRSNLKKNRSKNIFLVNLNSGNLRKNAWIISTKYSYLWKIFNPWKNSLPTSGDKWEGGGVWETQPLLFGKSPKSLISLQIILYIKGFMWYMYLKNSINEFRDLKSKFKFKKCMIQGFQILKSCKNA